VFWWEGAGLRTPALDLEILRGIGRTRVLELGKGQEIRGPRTALDGARVPADPRTAELARRFWPVG